MSPCGLTVAPRNKDLSSSITDRISAFTTAPVPLFGPRPRAGRSDHASAALGHLRKSVFVDNDIGSNTKIMVYKLRWFQLSHIALGYG
eukprot:g20196.t1